MKRSIHLILLSAVLTLMAGCSGNGASEQGTGADSIYTWENIRKSMMEEPEHALKMLDTAEVRGVMDVNEANHWRACIYYNSEKIHDFGKAKDYSMMVLSNTKPACDSAQYLKTLTLLVSILRMNKDYPEAIRYAMEGARRAHNADDVKSEALFYCDAGFMMESTQYGSGIKYVDRALDILREDAHADINSLPVLESCLGNTARRLAHQGNNARAIELLEERLLALDHIERDIATTPKGFCDERRALTYSVLAYSYWAVGNLAKAKKTAEAFERIRDKVSPSYQIDMMNYYAFAGDGSHVQQYYDRLEPIIHERFDTISDTYKNLLNIYANGLYHAGSFKEAYETLDRHNTLNDSLAQREHQEETLKYAQQMRTQEKELQLKDEETKTTIYRILAVAAILICLLIAYLLWRSHIYNKVLLEKNRRLLAEIEQREHKEQQAIEQLKAEPEESLTTEQQLFRRICDLMESSDRIYTEADLDRSRLAQLLGTNEHYVTDAISSCTNGKSVNGFLNEYRLKYATHLLATTKDSVALIAELSGFSRSSFFRIFSEAYGMSPSDYRRVARK